MYRSAVEGFPYARTSCSLFVEDVNLLIDTPEDINASLPAILADIKKQGTKYGSIIEYYEAKGLVKQKKFMLSKKVIL